MSILINGVNMPRNCHECDSFGFSDIVGLKCPKYDFNERPKGCPLTKIPEHHGRLVDIDKAEKEIRAYIVENKESEDLYLAGCGDGAYHALITLKCATVIPATKEGDAE